MKRILALFVVLFFVVGCGGGSGDSVTEMIVEDMESEEVMEPIEETPEPDPMEAEIPEEPEVPETEPMEPTEPKISELEEARRIVDEYVCTDEYQQAVNYITLGGHTAVEVVAAPEEWNGTPFVVDISSGFSNANELLGAVSEGAERVNQVLGYKIFEAGKVLPLTDINYTHVQSFTESSRQYIPPDQHIYMYCCNERNVLGSAYPWWRLAILNNNPSSSRPIIMHELYHILGLTHSTNPSENLIQESYLLRYGFTQEQIFSGEDGIGVTRAAPLDLAKVGCIYE